MVAAAASVQYSSRLVQQEGDIRPGQRRERDPDQPQGSMLPSLIGTGQLPHHDDRRTDFQLIQPEPGEHHRPGGDPVGLVDHQSVPGVHPFERRGHFGRSPRVVAVSTTISRQRAASQHQSSTPAALASSAGRADVGRVRTRSRGRFRRNRRRRADCLATVALFRPATPPGAKFRMPPAPPVTDGKLPVREFSCTADRCCVFSWQG
jgi:hypothetical protein